MNSNNEVTLHRSEILPRREISDLFEFTSGLMWTCSNMLCRIHCSNVDQCFNFDMSFFVQNITFFVSPFIAMLRTTNVFFVFKKKKRELLLPLPLLSPVRLWLANLIDWLISLVHQFRLNEHQLAEMLLIARNYQQLQSYVKMCSKMFHMSKQNVARIKWNICWILIIC